MAEDRFIVLSRAVAGREADYEDWYSGTHLDEIVGLGGVVDGRFYKRCDEDTPAPGDYLALYTLAAGKVTEVLARMGRMRADGEMSECDALDRGSVAFLVARSLGPLVGAAAYTDGAEEERRFVVLTLAAPAAHGDCDPSFDRGPLRDTLQLPGVIAGQCFALQTRQGASAEWQYAVLHLFGAEPGQLLAGMTRRRGLENRRANLFGEGANDVVTAFRALTPLKRSGV